MGTASSKQKIVYTSTYSRKHSAPRLSKEPKGVFIGAQYTPPESPRERSESPYKQMSTHFTESVQKVNVNNRKSLKKPFSVPTSDTSTPKCNLESVNSSSFRTLETIEHFEIFEKQCVTKKSNQKIKTTKTKANSGDFSKFTNQINHLIQFEPKNEPRKSLNSKASKELPPIDLKVRVKKPNLPQTNQPANSHSAGQTPKKIWKWKGAYGFIPN